MLTAFEEAGAVGSAHAGIYACAEAWVREDADGSHKYDLTTKPLPENELQDWAWRTGVHAPSPNEEKDLGRIRLLFAQSTSALAKGIPQALRTTNVLEALQLPKSSFHSFKQPAGVFSVHTQPGHIPDGGDKRLGIFLYTSSCLLFRTPQKWECSIGLFAVSHSFETRTTTALSLGYAFEIDKLETETKLPASLARFFDQLEDNRACWVHPLLLPCMFLATHALRVETYVRNTIGPELVRVKGCIGVTRAGMSQKQYLDLTANESDVSSGKLFVGGRLHRENAKRLTASINDLSTWIIFAKRAPLWDVRCAEFLLGVLERDQRLGDYGGVSGERFQEALLYIRNSCEACLHDHESAEAQMKLQLEILYTSIAQDDGQTSARIAASAGKDSTSMKIIAVITAAYLPGTFVATLFSMGMFSWRSSDGDGSSSHRASPDFWIYWAVTAPLTIATIAGWAMWWKFEMHRLDRSLHSALPMRTTAWVKRSSELSTNSV